MVEFNPKDYKVETTKSWGSIGTIMDAKTLALRVCKELGLNPYGDEIALLNSSVGYKIYIKRAGLQKLITPRIARQYTDIIEIEKNGKDKSVILRVTIETKDGKFMSGLGAADNVSEKALQGDMYSLHKLISIAETRAQMRIQRALLGEYDVFEDYIEAVPKDSDKVVDLKKIMSEVDAELETKKQEAPKPQPKPSGSFLKKITPIVAKETPPPIIKQSLTEPTENLNDITGLGIDIEDIIRPQIDEMKSAAPLEKKSAKAELLNLDFSKILGVAPKPKPKVEVPAKPIPQNPVKQLERPEWYAFVTEGLTKNKSTVAKELAQNLFEHYFRGVVSKDDQLISLFDKTYKIGFNDIYAGSKTPLIQFYETRTMKTVELLKDVKPNQFSYLYIPKEERAIFLSEVFIVFSAILDKHAVNDKKFPDYELIVMIVGPPRAEYFYDLFQKMEVLK